MALRLGNNVETTLAVAAGVADTAITVSDGSAFPPLSAGDFTFVTLEEDTFASPAREVVKVTALSGNVLTVERAQDGTTASSFPIGSKVELRVTAALLDELSRSGWEITTTAPTSGAGKPNGYIWFVV